ncbi:hypothetical protein RJ55_00857 [Drechmeria coniospora]|nr:hypothetical protein RJ55_00857 [Drechmeria coniospora]
MRLLGLTIPRTPAQRLHRYLQNSFPPSHPDTCFSIRPQLTRPSFSTATRRSRGPSDVAMASSDFDFVKKMTPATYTFPSHRLRRASSSNTPLVLVSCGSFSPITFLHLRMFPMARDHSRNEGFEVVGGYLSPVSDAYKKKGLAPAVHRIRMCELATENTSKWLMVDPWEAESPTYIPTARVLDHFDYEINHVMGGVECTDGTRKPAKIVLLAGADLIQTISTPEVWDARDVEHILGNFGAFVLERTGTELDSALASLKQWEKNIHVIRQVVTNDVSSTKVRLLLKRNLSIDYIVPDDVVNYIYEHDLYRDLDLQRSEKEKDGTDDAAPGPRDG